MAFSFTAGDPVAALRGGSRGDKLLGIVAAGSESALGRDIELRRGAFEPVLSLAHRSIDYIAGPSGAGKTTYLAGLAARHQKINPEAPIVVFARGAIADDPALAGLAGFASQAEIGKKLLEKPIDVLTLEPGTLLIFDDVATILDDKYRTAVSKLVMDCAEVGRKANIHMLMTSHLISPNDRKLARVILNEMEFLTVFPAGSGAHQITYVLQKYLGLSKAQVTRILDAPGRWVRIHCHAPRWVMTETSAWML